MLKAKIHRNCKAAENGRKSAWKLRGKARAAFPIGEERQYPGPPGEIIIPTILW